MKVLTIGNNYTSAALAYLPALAVAGGKELLLSNLCTDNCSIEHHYRNYIDEAEVYYYETYLPGITEMMRPDGIALHEAVEDDDWDMIIFCQNPALSGKKASYKPYLGELAAYCKLMHPEVKLMLIEPWAGGENSEEKAEKIHEACRTAKEDAELDGIINIGKAWQIAEGTGSFDKLIQSGDMPAESGKFLCSCVLYEAIFGESAVDVEYDLPGIPEEISSLLKICAES